MEITRTFDMLDQIGEKYGHKEDILAARTNGDWKKYSSKEYVSTATAVAYGLMALELKPGDRIVTISNNRPEWNFMDMGMSMAGIVQVPVYPTISAEEYAYILDHAAPKLVVLSDKQLFDKISPIAEKVKSISAVYTFNEIEGARNWKEIVELGNKNADTLNGQLEKTKNSIQPEDLLTILYTSGTTGMPKGVMLSHRNLVSNTIACNRHINLGSEHRALSFLPISHVYERMINYIYQYKGISVYYAENIGTIARDAQDIRPNIFGAVPRLLESVYDKIIAKGKDLSGIKKTIFFWAVKLGNQFDPENGNSAWYKMKLKVADKLIFSKWREVLGGCNVIITGSAAIQPRLVRVFWAAGLEVYEGYGLTETSPVISVANQTTREVMVGSAGQIIDGVEVKIAEDGEILARGPNVMMGYYKDPEMTKKVIDPDGFFYTGDIGEIAKGNWLKITDRKKEIFKLSSGKYIAPQAIENKFKESFFIEQLMVIGFCQKFASAIIHPNLPYLKEWAEEHGMTFSSNEEMIRDKRVIDQVQKEVNKLNAQLGQVERIKRFRLVADEWTPQSGLMSPTMKLKRRVIEDKYMDLIQEIFSVDAEK
ncbi:MAG: long-chain fatty acid--CoA ligase [Bacteroidales bacterium]|nr:long-chain fatty acid--CoA ligase [Bacteroidales bacterium]MDT8431543.1 long-chain fatty acid--CoA ligase [Bacteroidales bacterium]